MTVRILALTTDLFVQSRVLELAKSSGAVGQVVTTEQDLLARAESSLPHLVVLDLASAEYDPFSCAEKLKSMVPPPRILGFFPHVRLDLQLKAKRVGIDYIVPNSSFLKTLKVAIGREGKT